MKKIFFNKYILCLSFMLLLGSCTKLDEQVLDEVLGDDASNPEGALAAAYDRLGKGTFVDHGGVFALQQYTTDEAILATRGSDWGDGGKWRSMHEFTWTPDNAIVTDNWNMLTNGITRAMTAIKAVTASNIPQKKLFLAESRGLLAFYMYTVLDLYGQVPYRDPLDERAPLEIKKAASTIDELIVEVERLLPDLASLGDQSTHNGRFTKEAAYGLLTQMYLNRAVFKNRMANTYEFTEKAVSGEGTDMDRVIYYSSLLINSSKFRLESNYFNSFSIKNEKGPELIWVITQKIDKIRNGSNSFAYVCVERNQRPTPVNRGTNAACITPEFYATWNGNHDDPRFSRKYQYSDGTWFYNDREQSVPSTDIVPGTNLMWFHFNRGIIEGQQYGPKLTANGAFEMTVDGRIKVSQLSMEKSAGTKMVFTPELNFDDPKQAVFKQDQINRGVRVFKYEYDPGDGNGSSNVDIPLVRLGAIYTMRAEAYFRKGEVNLALNDINKLRSSRTRESLYGSEPGKTISSLNAGDLYREIAFETYWELLRRPQMIRFGKYDLPYSAKPATQPFRRLFPIPQSVMDVTKDFKQNEGY
ncbi:MULTISPECIES: RagB/SusD family nutrient uptake outer membrane protein [unclassified Sphingobacterium]|uniref:RagB/SusD family nutrient uptake outer membrane protein n=1 Tax=unclassified Sphingobacterium TaxID=2609468 RepID=UPI002952F21B|nr:RagB/SusD family nutrient uptake outer membrane protein [Sphingobacterium sp. UGAL515B_05]WON92652.1 RagB/SusD family nutrient uptake outer membrane protein [Sphingobacterium sp. UGAL515B_05]